MSTLKKATLTLLGCGAVLGMLARPVTAQLGRQQGLLEPNVAADSSMLRLPQMTPAIVQALRDARPILSATALDGILASKALTGPQRTELYRSLFVHVDLNRGSDAEFMLIPGVNASILQSLKAGRPWKTFEQFQSALTPTVGAAEATRLERYLFIPIELNTWTAPIMDSFAPIGVGTARWKREFEEYRPWTSMAQFEREISKYLRANPEELKRLERYVTIAP